MRKKIKKKEMGYHRDKCHIRMNFSGKKSKRSTYNF